MSRIPGVQREDLPPDQQHHFDYIAGNRPEVRGPFPILLNSPDVASRIAHVGTYIRFETSLDAAVRELAIITTARAWDCQYEWTMHEPFAREAGVRAEAITAVRDRTAPQGLTQDEAVIFDYVDSLLRNRRVPRDTFEKALAMLGRQGITDLTTTAGYYSLLACVLDSFAVNPDTPALLPNAEY